MARKPLAEVLGDILGDVPISISAYDGSKTGPDDAGLAITIRSPKALSYLISAPGSLGLARAYVSGELELDGDLYATLSHLWSDDLGSVSWTQRFDALRNIDPKALRYVEPPAEEYGVRRFANGFRHSKKRDAEAIHHHYDVSNTFYEWVLGPSMTYTCACYPTAESTLEEAQAHKYDLVCRKLGLQPGMRLLDVGCGWGGMVRHAARHYGVRVIGVTLSHAQAEWGQAAVEREGLADVAEVRYGDYRDITESGFDAVSSIGLTEHIGLKELPNYFAFLNSRLRPQGRLLNHCITRPTTREGVKSKGFIDRYVFPDGELEAVGTIVSAMQDQGFEVRHEENLREHYAMTLKGWCDNLDAHWRDAVAEVGEPRARVWKLYMAGSRLGFERRAIELHQVLGVKTDEHGAAAMPLRPDWGV